MGPHRSISTVSFMRFTSTTPNKARMYSWPRLRIQGIDFPLGQHSKAILALGTGNLFVIVETHFQIMILVVESVIML